MPSRTVPPSDLFKAPKWGNVFDYDERYRERVLFLLRRLRGHSYGATLGAIFGGIPPFSAAVAVGLMEGHGLVERSRDGSYRVTLAGTRVAETGRVPDLFSHGRYGTDDDREVPLRVRTRAKCRVADSSDTGDPLFSESPWQANAIRSMEDLAGQRPVEEFLTP